MEGAGRALAAGSRLMSSLVLLVLLVLVSQRHTVSGKLRGLSLRQGALNLPPLDPALIRGILPPAEIAAFSRHTVLSRRYLIRQYALHGVPQFGVGPLDPFPVPDLPVNFTMDVVELEGNITNGMVRGLQDLQLLDVDIHLPGLSVAADIRIPLVTLDAKYSLDGSFSGLFPLTGAGPLTLKLIDVDVKVIMQARLYYDRLHITRVDFTLAIANTTINLEGFLKDSGFGDIAQQFLNGMSGDFLKNFIKTFREERLPSLVMRGNKFLKDFQWRSYLPTFVAIYLGFEDDSGSPYYKDYIPTITNNHLIDRIMRSLSHFLYGRRIGLPAQDIMATKKILFTWWVRTGIQLFRGHLFGAHNIRRIGDALISRHKEYFTFTIDVAVFNLKAAYKAQLVVLNRPVKFTLWSFISHIKMRVQVQLDAEYMDIYLTALDVLHIGKIDVKLAGLGPLELVANNIADKQINSDTTKRLLARIVARDARDAVAKQIRGVDINSILAETINGDVYARDPGIVFPDPEPEGNGTDFNSLLDSVLGTDDEDDAEIDSLLTLLLGDDEEGAGGFNNTDDIDPDTLSSLGLDGVDSNSSSSDPDDALAGVDAETLALFGLSPTEPKDDKVAGQTVGEMAGSKDNSDSDDALAGVDAETLALFGLSPTEPKDDEDAGGQTVGKMAGNKDSSDSDDPLAGVDAETLALFGLSQEEPKDANKEGRMGRKTASKTAGTTGSTDDSDSSDSDDELADLDAETLALFGLSSSQPDNANKEDSSVGTKATNADSSDSDDPLAGLDAETLALFGISPTQPDGDADGGVGGGLTVDNEVADAESPSGPTAAAVELQQILGGDGGAAGKAGLRLEADDSTIDDGGSLFDPDDNNSFFDSDSADSAVAADNKSKKDVESDDSLFDPDDNNSFFNLRRRRG